MVQTIKILICLFGVAFLYYAVKDLNANKDNFDKKTNVFITGIIAFVTNFFDALGIGSFAPLTALLRMFKQIDNKYLPGTLNVGCCLPVLTEGIIFISIVEVDPVTLISMIVSATAGAYLGSDFVSRLDEAKVEILMGFALLATLSLFLMGQFELMPVGGEAVGLTGVKLVIGVVGNFILGALMSAGIGLYAPCMALVYMLGMSSAVSFPIMMGSCAFLQPVASIKFIKKEAYSRKASLIIAVVGVVAVIVATKVFSGLSTDQMKWLVDIVVLYAAVTLLKSGFSKKNEAN